jgi:bifunctional DNase/RNase
MTPADDGWIPVLVIDVRRPATADEPHPGLHWVVLKEVEGELRMVIWMGKAEALALALELERVEMPRPRTYALTVRLLEASGSRLVEAQVSRLEADTFYATLILDGPNGRHEIDARPSDALNLALRTHIPIRVARDVMERCGADADVQRRIDASADSTTITTEIREYFRESGTV